MTSTPQNRRKLPHRVTLAGTDFLQDDALLADARRLEQAVGGFLARQERAEAERRALAADVAYLLESLLRAKAVVAGKLNRGMRAAGAMNAYAKAGRSGRA